MAARKEKILKRLINGLLLICAPLAMAEPPTDTQETNLDEEFLLFLLQWDNPVETETANKQDEQLILDKLIEQSLEEKPNGNKYDESK